MKRIFTLTILIVLGVTFAKAQTNVPALITSDQVWDISGSPYLISTTTNINAGVKVTVMPGVHVKNVGKYQTFIIDGELQAIGNKDSIIVFDSMELKFSASSKDYDPVTGEGAYFNYCEFNGQVPGKFTINIPSTNLRVENSTFNHCYYAIYCGSSYNAEFLYVDNCVFNDGYSPIYCSGSYRNVVILNSTFYYPDYGYMYCGGQVLFKNNQVDGLNAINFYIHRRSHIACNTFKNMPRGVTLSLRKDPYNLKTMGSLNFVNNTMDSCGSYTNNPMLDILNQYPDSAWNNIFQYNNFLYNTGQDVKVSIHGSNSNFNTSANHNFQNNYWGDTVAANIPDLIKDYTDDIQIYATLDFSNFLKSPNTSCGNYDRTCDADFNFEVKDDTVYFSDNSFTHGGSHIVGWDYGDESVDTGSSAVHVYKYGGTYIACIYIFDPWTGCADTVCKTVYVEGGEESSCEASFFLGQDTTDIYKLYLVNTSKGVTSNTKYLWAFGDNQESTDKTPSHTYQASGVYHLSLTIDDDNAACYSTFVDTIVIDQVGSGGYVLEVLDQSTLSTDDLEAFNDMHVYPNPSTGSVNVSLEAQYSEEVNVIVRNVTGQVVYQSTQNLSGGQNRFTLDLGNLENGLYFITLGSERSSGTSKVILNK